MFLHVFFPLKILVKHPVTGEDSQLAMFDRRVCSIKEIGFLQNEDPVAARVWCTNLRKLGQAAHGSIPGKDMKI
jgi:hypothetical protein